MWGVAGIQAWGAGCAVGRGVGLRSVVRRGCAVGRGVGLRGGAGIRARGAGWGGDSSRGAGVGIFLGKMGNFLPFCRFFAVWVEIYGQ